MFFPRHVIPFAHYKVAHDAANLLPEHIAIREDGIDRSSEVTQTIGAFVVLTREVSETCSCIRIANP
ncbi:hypothetical protein FBZ93_111175 [Bradyrhizobium macuxiense]|uniref:Uncharacterized protein n=1 Tax=Bradyrhizobium macuxiense TaxID=1755647 RepID=A0A560LC30_9BRAD|nr:hypothetical protein FBZ93_111175 [Bradyrhizobium macuxiense]